jgi:hypothetical protein
MVDLHFSDAELAELYNPLCSRERRMDFVLYLKGARMSP